MQQEYDLGELLKNPDKRLTKEQYENWNKYISQGNDDKSANEVDISAAINKRCEEIRERGTYVL
ncbi:MAG: hypothetical protein LBH98_06265 [Chitinispirillales bacterium]|jgi:hypothetical protein|nr:hypothetical protein [Chitinispirillales bacterium]